MRPPARLLSLRAFRLIGLVLLVPVAPAVAWFSPVTAAWIAPLDPESPTALSVLAVVLTAIPFVVVWLVALLPFRARTELGPLRQDWDELRDRGGLVAAYREQQQKLRKSAASDDVALRRGYYARMTGAGLFVWALIWLVAWVAWSDGQLGLETLLAAIVAPGVALWYGVRFVVLGVGRATGP